MTKKYNKIAYFSKVLFQTIILISFVLPMTFPQYAIGATMDLENEMRILPKNEMSKPDEIRIVTVTAYSSTPDQTDSTPFITANQTRVRWGIVAANSTHFNSKVRFPEYFGDKIFLVTDRTHPRFGDRIDIWFPTRADALAFGKRRLEVEIWK